MKLARFLAAAVLAAATIGAVIDTATNAAVAVATQQSPVAG